MADQKPILERLEAIENKLAFLEEFLLSRLDSPPTPFFKDEMYSKAVNVLLNRDSISGKTLMKELGVGLARVTRIMEQLENDGFISPADGSIARRVIFSVKK